MVMGNACAADLHVAPNGNDANTGTAAQPFATPGKALATARALKQSAAAGPVAILLHAGTYRLEHSLAMDARDSGSATAPVTWRAAGDGEVILSGGYHLPSSALHPVKDAATLARLPAERDKSLQLFEIDLSPIAKDFPALEPRGMPTAYASAWPELFLGGQPLPMSAWPNGTGYTKGFKPNKIISAGTTAKVTAAGASATANTATGTTMAFSFTDKRVERWRKAINSHHAAVWMGGHWYWDWADDLLPVAGIDGNGVITIGRRHSYGIGKHVNLHVYNLVEEMDVAGEYAIEPGAKRMLVLLTAAQADAGLALSWLGMPLVEMKSCAHIRFQGIQFALGRSDAVHLDNGSHINFSRCGFTNLGRHGISAKGTGIVVEDCVFTRIGATGVAMDGGDRRTLVSGNNRVAHCEFDGFSRLKRTYAPGVSASGVGVTVENNLFHDSPHTAILFGGNDHRIRNNEIHTVLTETGDCGAIYGGRDWAACGTEITGNWIHDLGGMAGRWPCGIYLDDALSGIIVKNNLVDKVSLGLLVGGGRHNQIEGNIFSRCDEAMHLDSRGIGWMGGKGLDTLKKRLAEMPVDKEPWASRFPMLKDTLKNDPGKPVGTRITGNAAVACKKTWKAKSPAGVAVVTPNWENMPAQNLQEKDGKLILAGTPITFTKPMVGARK